MPVPADIKELLPEHSADVIALWGDKDEESVVKWMDEKRKDFEDGGKMKEKHETTEALEAFMKNKVYGPGGTMDKTPSCAATRRSSSTWRPTARRWAVS